jgi:hypothetical protein
MRSAEAKKKTTKKRDGQNQRLNAGEKNAILSPTFDEVLDAAEQLDAEAKAELVAILSRRLAEAGRTRVLASVLEAEKEFAEGKCKSATPAEIMREAMP